MRKLLLCLIAIGISSNICALTLEDIITLSRAQIDDQVIVGIIDTSDTKFKLTTDDIISLKNSGVSEKVILAIIENGPPKIRRRELSPFDQFFLSPYYSHQYGWPKANYKSPSEILGLGLYYQPPESYPGARRVRIYGGGYSYDRRRQIWNYSPYSLIVPRKRKHYRYLRRHHWRRPENVHLSPPGAQLEEQKLTPTEISENRTGQHIGLRTHAAPGMHVGKWYNALLGALDTLENQAKQSAELEPGLTFYFIDIQSYARKMREYENMVRSIQFRAHARNERKNLSDWISSELKRSVYLEEKNTLRTFKAIVTYGKVELGVEDEVMELVVYSVDWQQDLKNGKLREQLLKNIIARLDVIHRKFSDLYRRADDVLYRYEVK